MKKKKLRLKTAARRRKIFYLLVTDYIILPLSRSSFLPSWKHSWRPYPSQWWFVTYLREIIMCGVVSTYSAGYGDFSREKSIEMYPIQKNLGLFNRSIRLYLPIHSSKGEVFASLSPPGSASAYVQPALDIQCTRHIKVNSPLCRSTLPDVYTWRRGSWKFWPWLVTFYRYITRAERSGVYRDFKQG